MAFLDKNSQLHFICGDGEWKNTFHHFERDASTLDAPSKWKHTKLAISTLKLQANLTPHVTQVVFDQKPKIETAYFVACDERGHNYRVKLSDGSIAPITEGLLETGFASSGAFWTLNNEHFAFGIIKPDKAGASTAYLLTLDAHSGAYKCIKMQNVPSTVDILDGTHVSVLLTPVDEFLFWTDSKLQIHSIKRSRDADDWTYVNLTTSAISKQAFSAPVPCATTPHPVFRDGKTVHVYYISRTGTLEELIKRREKPWKHISLPNYVAGAQDLKFSVGVAFLSELHAFFIDSKRRLKEILWKSSKWNLFNVSELAVNKIKIDQILHVVSGLTAHVFVTEKHSGHFWHFYWNEKWIAHCLTELEAAEQFVPPHSKEAIKLAKAASKKGKGKEKDVSESSSTNDNVIEPPAPPPLPQQTTQIVKPILPAPKPLKIDLPRKQGNKYFIPSTEQPLRLVIVSDTHNYVNRIPMPPGDILIHAGDFTVYGSDREIEEFREWLQEAPFKHKIVINGNHEVYPARSKAALQDHCHFLDNDLIHLCGIKIYGTSWKTDYATIPNDIDILITHKPPMGYGDIIYTGESRGSSHLTEAVNRVQPHLHIFGHNHEGYGAYYNQNTTFVNAATALGGAKSVARRHAIVIDYFPAYKSGYTGLSQ